MGFRYAVLGAGRQGVAIAYDLARHGEAAEILMADADEAAAKNGAARVRALRPGVPVRARCAALEGPDAVELISGFDVVVSALPYRLNPAMARASVEARASFCDLGGNTDFVREALTLDADAKAAGVTLVPDCGLAPGLSNVLAAHAVTCVPGARHVRIRCGGLPVHPKGPLGYSLLFSIEGLTNEYTGEAVVLREGEIRHLEAFTEVEPFRGPKVLGRCEAFLTSGGTSTAPWTFLGRLETYDYKTVRYEGHYAIMRAIIDLGLLDTESVDGVRPRDVFHAVCGPRLDEPEVEDLAVLRVDCIDEKGRGVRFQMLQYKDAATGFTAMEQGTGYPTAVVAHAMARRELPAGALTPERAGFGEPHLRALRKRGLRIHRRTLG